MDAKILARRWLVIAAVTFALTGAVLLGVFLTYGTRQGDFETAARTVTWDVSFMVCLVAAGGLTVSLARTESAAWRAAGKSAFACALLLPAPFLFISLTSWVQNDYGPVSGAGELVLFWILMVIPAAVGGALIALAARKVGLWAGVALALAFLAVVARLWLVFSFGI